MMSFFKKETKEDKERKKLEKKLSVKDSSFSTTSTNANNNNNTNGGISLASSSLSNLNNTNLSADINNINNNNNNKSNIVITNEESLFSQSATSFNHHNQTTSNANYSHIDLAEEANPQMQATAGNQSNEPPPPLPSNGPPPVAPKPKKGILKTMSKFGIGHNSSHSQSSTLPLQSASYTNVTNANSAMVASPKLFKTPKNQQPTR